MGKTEKVLAIALLAAIVFRVFFLPATVTGSSMEPTISDSDIVISERGDVEFYDVVIAWSDVLGEYVIKRVIGIPGDTIRIADGQVIRNGEVLTEDFDLMESAGIAAEEITLGEDEYFLLGDNRNASTDSRVLGAFSGTDIKGAVVLFIDLSDKSIYIW